MSSKKTKKKTTPTRSVMVENHAAFWVLPPKTLGALATILIATFICYLPVFDNGFVNWDDDKYIYDNPLIRELNFKDFFSGFVMANYHPLVISTYAFIYKFFGPNPDAYHAVNLLFHLANTALVFFVFMALAQKMEIAFVVSLLFGVHPLHVESVAWASELKDVMYAFFFLISFWCYLNYLNKGFTIKYYIASVLFFILSLLSKAMGVSLFAVFILSDYFLARRLDMKAIMDKLPFLLIGLLFGIIAIIGQKNSFQEYSFFTFWERILFACYGLVTYLHKLILPINLFPYYPYPDKGTEGIPFYFYYYPFILLVFLLIILYSLKFTKKIFFGFAFVVVTIVLVLQILPVGDAIMADRYVYIPSIGIFYFIALGIAFLRTRLHMPSAHNIMFAALIFFYGTLTFKQILIWKDSVTLWTHSVKYPNQSYLPYLNLANALDNVGDFEGALANFTKSIERDSNYVNAYVFRGIIKSKLNDFEGAVQDMDYAIKISPRNADAYFYKGNVMVSLENYEAAIQNFKITTEIDQEFAGAYYNSAMLKMQLNDYDGAIKDFDKTIMLQKQIWDSYENRGNAKLFKQDYKGAVSDYNMAIDIKQNPAIYNNRGIAKYNLNDYAGAINDYSRAISLNTEYAISYLNRGNSKAALRDTQGAIEDYSIAISLQPENANVYYKRASLYHLEGKKSQACSDMNKAISLGYKDVEGALKKFCQ